MFTDTDTDTAAVRIPSTHILLPSLQQPARKSGKEKGKVNYKIKSADIQKTSYIKSALLYAVPHIYTYAEAKGRRKDFSIASNIPFATVHPPLSTRKTANIFHLESPHLIFSKNIIQDIPQISSAQFRKNSSQKKKVKVKIKVPHSACIEK
jgi:hypothetical protein